MGKEGFGPIFYGEHGPFPATTFARKQCSASMADDEVMADAEKDKKVDKTGPGGTVPWVERYRPSTIDELQQQDQVARALLAAPLAPAGCRRRRRARNPRPAPVPPCGLTRPAPLSRAFRLCQPSRAP